MTWNSVSSSSSYKLELDDDISFATPVITATISGSTNFTVPVPLAKGSYYWHVSSNSDYTVYSLIDSFTLSKGTLGLELGTADYKEPELKLRDNILVGASLINIPRNTLNVNVLIVSLAGKKVMVKSLRSSELQTEFAHSIESRLCSGNYIVILDFLDKNGFHLSKISKPFCVRR